MYPVLLCIKIREKMVEGFSKILWIQKYEHDTTKDSNIKKIKLIRFWKLVLTQYCLSFFRMCEECFFINHYEHLTCPVGWGGRKHLLHLCRGVRPPPNECPGYDIKQSDGEVPVMLELWGIRSTSSLPSVPGPVWPGVAVLDRVLSMG